jgi:hypothetical protein
MMPASESRNFLLVRGDVKQMGVADCHCQTIHSCATNIQLNCLMCAAAIKQVINYLFETLNPK